MLRKFKNWLLARRQANYRRNHAAGRSWCGACCPQFVGGGPGLSVTVRNVLFYCRYDLPEFAGKPKRYDILARLNHQMRTDDL